jgi:hypothetical protein
MGVLHAADLLRPTCLSGRARQAWPAARPAWRDPLWWALGLLLALLLGMPALRPLFAALFPELDRPIYEQDFFVALALAHLRIVGLSSAAAVLAGVAAGVFVTRPQGREFRRLAESVVAVGQTFPPVAVLAVARAADRLWRGARLDRAVPVRPAADRAGQPGPGSTRCRRPCARRRWAPA